MAAPKHRYAVSLILEGVVPVDMVRKLLAAFHFAVALLVAVHFVFNSFYRDSLDTVDAWGILDWPVALAIVTAFLVHFQRKRALDRQRTEQAITQEYVEANAATYVTAVLALWFFSNWFNFLNYGAEGESTVNAIIWALVDVLVVLVSSATGRYLWRSAGDQ